MKFNLINTLFALMLSLLLAYICYTLCDNEQLRLLVSIGSFFPFIITSMIALGGVSSEMARTNVMIRLFASVMMLVAIVMNIIFSLVDFNEPWFFILNGLLLFVLLLVTVGITRQQQ